MTKIQKIWLGISSMMFLLPELLWCPISNFIYIFTQNSNSPKVFRDNFLLNSDNITSLNIVLFIQFLGILILLINLIKHKKSNLIFWLIILFLILLTVITFLIFYMSVTIGRNGIGF